MMKTFVIQKSTNLLDINSDGSVWINILPKVDSDLNCTVLHHSLQTIYSYCKMAVIHENDTEYAIVTK